MHPSPAGSSTLFGGETGLNVGTPGSEMLRQRSRASGVRGPQEGPRELCTRLHALGHRWLQPETRSKAKMLDLVVLEQLLAVLPPKVGRWVRECGADSTCQAVALAEGYLLSQPEEEEKQVPGTVLGVGCQMSLWSDPSPAGGILGNSHENGIASQATTAPGAALGPPAQGSVSFEEVAVYFSNAEWALLGASQKALHREVMLENSKSVAALAGNGWEGDLGDHSRDILLEKTMCPETEDLFGNREGQKPPEGNPAEKVPGASSSQPTHSDLAAQGARLHGKRRAACSMCEKTFSPTSDLGIHRRIHADQKQHPCPECGRRFLQSAHLAAHRSIHTGEKPHPCPECGKRFRHLAYLDVHRRIHTGEKPYRCAECGKRFNRHSNLACHLRKHSGEKPYACPECGKRFGDKSGFNLHQMVHSQDKPHKCPVCGRGFIRRSQLTSHERIHTGEKPYACPECGKRFHRHSNLTSHQRIHAEEKPFVCPECGKRFYDKRHLLAHHRAHMGGKPYGPAWPPTAAARDSMTSAAWPSTGGRSPTGAPSAGGASPRPPASRPTGGSTRRRGPSPAPSAGSASARSGTSTQHKKIHSGEKPHQCPACGKGFRDPGQLRRHQRVHGGDEKAGLPWELEGASGGAPDLHPLRAPKQESQGILADTG